MEIDVDHSLEVELGRLLRLRGWKLSTAESCTGGLIADRITDVPGSSGVSAASTGKPRKTCGKRCASISLIGSLS